MTGSKIVLALDFGTQVETEALIARLQPAQCRLKVGLELYAAAGPDFVRALVGRGFDVFLDLKFHDIPNTVARACDQAARLGVWMLTLHALGGRAMLEAARAAVMDREQRPLLVAVTVLTSLTPADLVDVGLDRDVPAQVLRLARLAQTAGLDGVVCAPTEAAELRWRMGDDFTLVTPGIRPSGAEANDQRRSLTPAGAIAAGADYLVIGRPITRAADPVAALARIAREISIED